MLYDQIAAWLQVLLAIVSIFIALCMPSVPSNRLRSKRSNTRLKIGKLDYRRRVDRTYD